MEIEADENVSRVNAMLPDDARYAANRKLGNATQIREEIFHMNSMAFLESFLQDVRFALRTLRKNILASLPSTDIDTCAGYRREPRSNLLASSTP